MTVKTRYDRAIYASAVWTNETPEPLKPLQYPVDAVTYIEGEMWPKADMGVPTPAEQDIWITIEPDVREICQHIPSANLIRRIHELLGLPPADGTRQDGKFVRLTIEESQRTGPAEIGVFRPCADPTPTTLICGRKLAGPPAYQQWLLQQMVASHVISGDVRAPGYPFTGSGYTYDWGSDAAPRHIGVEEYVVPRGTLVTVREVVSAFSYCSSPH